MPASKTNNASYAWVILVIVFLASVAAPLNQSKVPPIMPVLMQEFSLSLGQAGWLMSIFALTGFFLALPAGIILQRWGPKITGMMALASLILGSCLGALSNSAAFLFTSRIIEGVGMGLIAVIAPAVIAMWFPPEKRGTPMGIWATWVPVGTLIIYAAGPALTAVSGWQSVWWITASASAIILILYTAFIKTPSSKAAEQGSKNQSVNLKDALKNKQIWMLGSLFACFTLIFMSIGTYFPTFLTDVHGFPGSQAAMIASISTTVVLISAPMAGILLDRSGSIRKFLSLPFLFIAVLLIFPFRVQGWQIYFFMILMGLATGLIPTATFAAAPVLMKKPEFAGIGMAVVMMGQNLGMVLGPILLGSMVEKFGWATGSLVLIPFSLLAFWIGRRVNIN